MAKFLRAEIGYVAAKERKTEFVEKPSIITEHLVYVCDQRPAQLIQMAKLIE